MAVLDLITVGSLKIYVVDTDPTSVGVDAPLGSLILMSDGSGTYQKINTGTTDWTKGVTIANSTGISSVGTVTTGIWNATTIAPGYGGTGLTSYATGDILYASAANTLSKLAIGTAGQVLTVAGGVPTWATPSSGTVTSVSGTTNRITSSGGATPVIDIAATYVGQSSITTLGTITTGVWNGTAIANANLANSSVIINGTSISLGASGTVTAAAGTLTGTTLNPSIISSSLTSVGTITTGVWNGTAIANANLANSAITINGSSTSLGSSVTITTTGTTNRISVTGGTGITPTIDIAATYIGQTSITTLGTIGTGTWQGGIIGATYGGTGVNNGSNTITLGGNFTTSGANALTLTTTGVTNVTLPVSGTLATQAYVDNLVSTNISWQIPANVATTAVLSGTMIANDGVPATGQRAYNTTTKTITWFATQGPTTIDGVTLTNGMRILVKNETATSGPSAGEGRIYNGIYVRTSQDVWTRSVDFDANPTSEIAYGDMLTVLAGTNNISTTWVMSNTTYATLMTDNITWAQVSSGLTYVGTTNRITITGATIDISGSYVGQSSITTLGTITTGVWNGTAIANANLANSSVTIGSTAVSLGATVTTFVGLTSVTSTTFVGALTGNASTATALATARTINGTAFDGTANITITAAAGTLTGTTLNATVVSSSLTSVGTITTGVWTGTAIAAANGGTGQTSYTIGDILFASSSSALSKLADVATGNVLISGGVGVAPSYGKVGLTTHVSGTLPVANGGTGVTTFGGTNRILFTTATDTLSSITTANDGVLITSGTGVPSISSTLPSAVQGNITSLGTVTSGTIANGVTVTLKDSLFTIQDDGDTTKQLQLQLSGITTATTRTLTIPDYSGAVNVRERVFRAAVTTTNTTATTIQTISTATGKTYLVETRVVSRRISGTGTGANGDSNGYIRYATYKNVGGTLTQVGTQSEYTAEDIAAHNVTWSTSGTNILIRVAGSTNNTVDWVATTETIEY